MKTILTIHTATYNRAYILEKSISVVTKADGNEF